MGATAQYIWHLVRGDDSTRVFLYQDTTGSPVDLTDFTAVLEYTRANVTDTIPGIIDAALGKITIAIENAITATWSNNPTFKLRLTTSGGMVTTIVLGEFEVEQ